MISIIIPCYNAEDYLSEALDSILRQSYADWELICVDDGSTDGTYEILSRYHELDARIHVVSQKNAGVSVARNRGLSESRGEYICFIDSDDVVSRNYLEVLRTLIAKEKADLAICGWTTSLTDLSQENLTASSICITSRDLIENICIHGKTYTIWCMLFRREIICQNAISYYAGCTRNEDWEFYMIYLAHISTIVTTSEKLYYYRQHPTSVMHSFNDKTLSGLGASSRVIDYYRKINHPQAALVAQHSVAYVLLRYVILTLLNHRMDLYAKLCEEYDCRSEFRKLHDYSKPIVRWTVKMYLFSERLFEAIFYVMGYFRKY